ncbi:MAG: thioredoxin domain-containing protein, partial [Gemmatimonadales bacterium]
TPAGEVFYGGTYFPPDGKYGRPGLRTVLGSVLEAYRDRREHVHSQAQAIRRVVDAHLDEGGQGPVAPRVLEEAERQMARVFDRKNGGFGTQPKFPHPGAVTLLLHRWWDQPTDEVRTIVDRTLAGMGRGGVYDQIGGGFHRYSVDAEWIVPHFEKMSYDNSELLRAYCDAYSLFGTDEYAEVARGIVRWVQEVASEPEAGYAASQDADVGLEDDGDYFTWTRDEASEVLDQEELDVAAAYYDIGTAGEMHHNPSKNVLYVATSVSELATRSGRTEEAVRSLLDSARRKLKTARDQRPAPFVDRTRYTAWNAMMTSALLRAGAVLNDRWASRHALDTLGLLRREGEADAVAHTPGGIGGLLDDQVQTAAAALDGYEATGDPAWLGWAEAIMDRVWRDYWDDERGGLFDIAKGRQDETGVPPARAKPVQDTPTPSPNGVAGIVAARLHELTGSARWQERGAALVAAFAGRASELGLYAAAFLLALDWQVSPTTHLVIVGPREDETAEEMRRLALATFVPRKVVQRLTTEEAGSRPLPAALAGMLSAASGSRAYLCTGNVCRRPAESVQEWRATLQARVLD